MPIPVSMLGDDNVKESLRFISLAYDFGLSTLEQLQQQLAAAKLEKDVMMTKHYRNKVQGQRAWLRKLDKQREIDLEN